MIDKKSYAVVAPSESSAAAANLKEAMIVFMLYVIQMEGCDEPWVSQQRYVNCIYSAASTNALFGWWLCDDEIVAAVSCVKTWGYLSRWYSMVEFDCFEL